MNNIKSKFDKINEIQKKVNSNLDVLERKYELFDSKNDKEKLRQDLNFILNSNEFNDPKINNNYLNYYDNLKSMTNQIMKNKNEHIGKPNELESKINNVDIKVKQTPHSNEREAINNETNSYNNKEQINDKKFQTKNSGNPNNKKVQQSKSDNSIPLKDVKYIDKEIIHKKQNIYLSNELVNLRCKLNKMKTKNSLLNNILTNSKEVKNFKLLEQFINKFIENLAVNWSEVVDLLIDDLLLEEVYVLNELELEKANNEYPMEIFKHNDKIQFCVLFFTNG
jgi:hypothetical protein